MTEQHQRTILETTSSNRYSKQNHFYRINTQGQRWIWREGGGEIAPMAFSEVIPTLSTVAPRLTEQLFKPPVVYRSKRSGRRRRNGCTNPIAAAFFPLTEWWLCYGGEKKPKRNYSDIYATYHYIRQDRFSFISIKSRGDPVTCQHVLFGL